MGGWKGVREGASESYLYGMPCELHVLRTVYKHSVCRLSLVIWRLLRCEHHRKGTAAATRCFLYFTMTNLRTARDFLSFLAQPSLTAVLRVVAVQFFGAAACCPR